MRIKTSILLLLCSLSASAYEIDFQINVVEPLEQVNVKVCFKDHVPRALYNGAYRDNRNLKNAVGPNGKPLIVSDNQMLLRGVKPNQCISYESSLSSAKQQRRSLYRAGKDIVVDNTLWLWQPTNIGSKDTVKLSFNLPKGYNVSTPWIASGKPNQFTLTSTPYDWDSRIAIGKFKVAPVKIAQQTIQVAILNSTEKRKLEYIEWIKQAASAIAGINGSYPVDNAQIIITPTGKKREAVPWGEVQRGGSVSAHFFVDSFRPIQEFKDDWTATHELSHMLVPFISRNELYLSEGIASYYQNVARGKAGMISVETAWDKLLAGFSRGTSSRRMQKYWTGAAIYMMADRELRKRSNNKQSLGTVLKQLNACCRPSTSSWSGRRLMNKFDELSHSKIFTTLYHKQEQAQEGRFPDILPVLRDMGIDELKRDTSKRLSGAALDIVR
ncbi:MAG: hypothetical protein MJK04_04790 [Psychrosphaera sp.]|nr:hypothetical protein [Psychrosphaera sp.]